MVLLVTGGTGLVGSFLIEIIKENSALVDQGCRVLVRNSQSKIEIENLGLTPVKADLNDTQSLKKAIVDVTSVLHLAARADDWASWNDLYKANIEGLENLVEACRYGNSDPFLVHVSSTGVYGHFIPSYPINESYKLDPTSQYQKSKYYQEKYLWKLREEERWDNFSILRPPSIIGPRDQKTISEMYKAVYEGRFPILRGGRMYATFIHPKDLSNAILLLDKNKVKSRGKAYNLKSFECRIIDFLDYAVKLINPEKQPKHLNYRLVYTAAVLSELYSKLTGKKTLLNRYRVTKFAKSRRYDDSKIRSSLGFTPDKDMETTLNESYDWLIKHNYLPPS